VKSYLVPFRSYRSLLFKFWTLRFWAPFPLEGLGTMYDVHLGLTEKRVVELDFFARCYGWGATGENRSKIGVLQAGGSVYAKFSRRRGMSPPIIFARIVKPMNALQFYRWQFSHKETLYQTSSSEVRLYTENGRSAFLSPLLGGLVATVRCLS